MNFRSRLLALFLIGVYAAPWLPTVPEVHALTGDGSAETPYIIQTCEDLTAITETAAHYELQSDLDCTSLGTIGPLFSGDTFEGTLDGNDFEVSGLTITGTNDVGLFATTDAANINDLDIRATVTGSGSNVGGIVGWAQNDTELSDVGFYGTVTGGVNNVGGLIGYADGDALAGLTLTSVYFNGDVLADGGGTVQYVGGVIGNGDYVTLTEPSASVDITIEDNDAYDIGGMAGYLENSVVDTAEAGGNLIITGIGVNVQYIGGLVGQVGLGTDITSSSTNVHLTIGTLLVPLEGVYDLGGLIGAVEVPGVMQGNHSAQTITVIVDSGNYIQYLGGLIGHLCSAVVSDDCLGTSLTDSYTNSTIQLIGGGIYDVGGFAGSAEKMELGNIYSYNSLEISPNGGAQFIGGLIGHVSDLTLADSYFDGDLTIDVINIASPLSDVGGLVGSVEYDADTSEFTNVYSEGALSVGMISPTQYLQFVGGLIGHSEDIVLTQAYSLMEVMGNADAYASDIGGLIGSLSVSNETSSVDQCYYYGTGSVEALAMGTQFIGGLIGHVDVSGSVNLNISDCFTDGQFEAPDELAGFIGTSSGDSLNVVNSYSSISLISEGDAAGFAYRVEDFPNYENIFSSNPMQTGLGSSGLISYLDTLGALSEGHFDQNLSELEDCVTSQIGENCTSHTDPDSFLGTSLTMPMSNWDFTAIWQINADNYPYLRELPNAALIGPNDPYDYGPSDYTSGHVITETQPYFTFTVDHIDASEQVGYRLEIESSETVLSYESALGEQGEFTFTVGQAEGSGNYLVGEEDMELESGNYRVLLFGIDSRGNESNDVEAAYAGVSFNLDATPPELAILQELTGEVSEEDVLFRFSSDDEGEVQMTSCGSGVTPYVEVLTLNPETFLYESGVTFEGLESGETYTCEVRVEDGNGNVSDPLQIGPFSIEQASRSGGSGGSGGARNNTLSADDETEETQDELSYEEELALVQEMGLVTKEMEVPANKCEALTILSRAFEWELDESLTEDGFSDTPEWCAPVASYAKEHGIVQGRSEGILGLDTPLSRYEFVVMMHRTLAPDDNSAGDADYEDSIVEWAIEAVNWAKEEGYMTGFGSGLFGGSEGILKQDIGVTLLRILLANPS